MKKAKNNTLGQFVDRVMKQKGLTLHDIERNSSKHISSSYVSRIVRGKVRNPGVEAITALAKGLDVNPFDVFAAASGERPRSKGEVSPLLLIEVLQKLVTNPELAEVISEWLKLSTKQRAVVMLSMKRLNLSKSQGRLSKNE